MTPIEKNIGIKQYNYHYNYLPKYSLFYVEVSKAACTTIKSFFSEQMLKGSKVVTQERLNNYINRPHVPLMNSPFVKPYQMGEKYFYDMMRSGEFKTVVVVRDPVSRLYSAYKDKIERNKLQADHVREVLGVNDKVISLDDFIRYINELSSIVEFNQHWRPMFEHLAADYIDYSHIIRFENLDLDMSSLAQEIGATWDSRKVARHSTGSRRDQLVSMVSEDSKTIINDVYSKDMAKWQYPEI